MKGKAIVAIALSVAVLLAVVLLVRPTSDSRQATRSPISVPLVMQY